MLKGTRVLIGQEAEYYRLTLNKLSEMAEIEGYSEVVVPCIWEASTFNEKISGETKEQMWKFKDRGGRDCCLIPEVTGIIQDQYNEYWSKTLPKPIKIFYQSKVYRYDRPQMGRYREFTQFGVEILGNITSELEQKCKDLLVDCISFFTQDFELKPKVQRGLGYYTEEGFEIECPSLGTQKQIAGGGKYKEGIGWAIGVERLILAAR